MNIEVRTSELSAALDAATRAIPAKSIAPVLTHVLIQTEGDAIKITGSDASITITATCPAIVDGQGEACLPGKLLSDFVRKLPSGSMTITVRNHAASIKCAGCATKIAGMDPSLYPGQGIETKDALTATIKRATLKRMAAKVKYAISPTDMRPALTGAYLEIGPEGTMMTATDGFQFCQLREDGQGGGNAQITAIIPHKAIVEIAKLPDGEGDVTIRHTDNRMQFDLGDTTIDTTLISGAYVDYQRILYSGSSTEIEINRRAMLDVLSRAALMVEAKMAAIFIIADNQLTVEAHSKEGELLESLDINQHGDGLTIAFSHKALENTLGVLDGDTVLMKLNGPTGICSLTSSPADDQVCIVLPVRRG